MKVLVAQSCLTLCDPLVFSPPGSSVHGDSPGKNTGVGSQALLQEIFPTQGLNPGLLHCRQMLYPLSNQGRPSEREVDVFVEFPYFLYDLVNVGNLTSCSSSFSKLSLNIW